MDRILRFLKSKRFIYSLATALAYGAIYLISERFFFIGREYHLYTPDWTAKNILWIACIISCIPGLFGWYRFSLITLLGYISGVVLGEIFGPTMRILDPGLPPMPVHDGWIISIITFLTACLIGIVYERYLDKHTRQA